MRTRNRLNLMRWLAGALIALAAVCPGARSQEAAPATAYVDHPSPKRPDFETFRILVERNIFDASRKGVAPRSSSDSAPPTQVLRLIGAWIDGSRALALFEDGAGSPWETLGPGATIAGYRIEQIRTDAAILKNEQQTLELRVGSGLAKSEDGAWHMIERVEPSAPVAEGAQNADKPPTASTATQPPPAALDSDKQEASSPDSEEQAPEARPKRRMRREFRP